MTTYTCERCSCKLTATETITCDPCHIGTLRELLASKVWRETRGPKVVADIEAELRMFEDRHHGAR